MGSLFHYQYFGDYAILAFGIGSNHMINASGHAVASFVATVPYKGAAKRSSLRHKHTAGGGNLYIAVGSEAGDANLSVISRSHGIGEDLYIVFAEALSGLSGVAAIGDETFVGAYEQESVVGSQREREDAVG